MTSSQKRIFLEVLVLFCVVVGLIGFFNLYLYRESELTIRNQKEVKATQKQLIRTVPRVDWSQPCNASNSSDENEQRLWNWRFVENLLLNERRSKRLPDVIGIGVEKCGTHAFQQFLEHHPMIKGRNPYEAHFFEARGYKPNDSDKYRDSMPEAADNVLVMEKTPAYFSFPPAILPLRIKNTAPTSKLILVLCDPSRRVISDYVQELIMETISKRQFPDVESYLDRYIDKYSALTTYADDDELRAKGEEVLRAHVDDYPSTILTTGLYALHLSRWRRHFNASRLHVVNGDEMLRDPGAVMEKVQDFLGIPRLLLREDFVRDEATGFFCFRHPLKPPPGRAQLSCMFDGKMRTRNGRVTISDVTIARLRHFYAPANAHLYRMIGQDFGW